ncbi:hypothetical protein [Nocardia vermiculata]|uniref:Uncharacterized protein n=1 Tax=Nocardia vermiculata TaxID=257274 RepID=A0A846Y7U0_9NOCA|nr:hypothetical protein [Nocardia vermiculata]NKY53932.1 hypothetical protein [Nocardia vermiculata]
MHVPDYVLSGDGPIPDELATLSAQPVTYAGEPMIALIRHATAADVATNGRLLSADLLIDGAMVLGARPATPTRDFRWPAMPGWSADFEDQQLLISAPLPDRADSQFYGGTFYPDSGWLTRARATTRRRGGVVVLIGLDQTVEDLNPAIDAERACWVRVPLTQHHE